MPLNPLLDTRSVDEAREQVAASYCPHRLRPAGTGAGFRARHADSGDGPLRVFALSYGQPTVTVNPVPFGDFVLVSRVVTGRLTVRSGGREHHVGPGQATALDAHRAHELEFGPGCRLVTMKFDRSLLDRVAQGVGGDRAPRSGGVRTGAPVDPARWRSVSDFVLTRALPDGLLSGHALTRRHVEEMAAAAVLEGFGVRVEEPAATPDPLALRRAVEHIRGHADQPMTLLEIAAAAGVGPRTLQRLFQRELGVSPMRYLRETRLRAVRAELLADEGMTVSEVASRWGFGNLGRFAGEYRARFGATPRADRLRGA